MKKATLVLLLMALVAAAFPQTIPAMPKVGITMGGAAKGDEVATSLQILALLTILSLAPAILMLTTCFTRIVIILGFVRTAL
ncbi:flagellar biosynthetic protein FliP, partial [bacterium]